MNDDTSRAAPMNRWLIWMFSLAVAFILIGLDVYVSKIERCIKQTCIPLPDDEFTHGQIVGLGSTFVGLITLVMWLGAAAICSQVGSKLVSDARNTDGKI